MREVKGVSVLIYDQVCAAEKRRRRKHGELAQAARRVVINPAVCEGCGDCGVQSNCTSIAPLETRLGRKRVIDQSSCNTDYSCVKGFCPSFVTITGATPKQAKDSLKQEPDWPELAEPEPAICDKPYNILINGIGGTGVITIGALLGMAAHLEGKQVSVLDMTGMSQKNGAVSSHVRISSASQATHAQRIASGEADLVLGCDMLTSASHDALAKMRVGRTHAVINLHQQATGQFTRQPDWQFPADDIQTLLKQAVAENTDYVDATRLATALCGDAMASNLFMLGFAWQKALLPVSAQALLRAIELNGVAVDANCKAFMWGRRTAVDLKRVEAYVSPARPLLFKRRENLDEATNYRSAFLTAYQNAAYAAQYTRLVQQVREAEARLGKGGEA